MDDFHGSAALISITELGSFGNAMAEQRVEQRVEIEPVPLKVSLERRGPLVVAVPRQQQPILKQSMVEDTTAEVCGTGTAKETS